MHEACGVLGIWAPEGNVAADVYFGLLQMQHRGQESAGIVVSHEGKLSSYLGMGTVDRVFGEEIPEEKLVKNIIELHQKGNSQENIAIYLKENKAIMKESVLEKLKGRMAIGHVRYSTTGAGMVANIQPMLGWFRGRQFAIGRNGSLVCTQKLREECERKGYHFKTKTDTEVIVALITVSQEENFIEALFEVLPRLKGAFSLAILFEDMVIGARDAFGVRPLCWGIRDGTYIVSSESCALDVLGAELRGEVSPGEIIIFQDGKEKRFIWASNPSLSGLCIFEYIYFARPDSIMEGKTVYKVRENMGRFLAKEYPTQADLAISIPDSGNPGVFGYALESGLPVTTYGLFRSHTVARTFIEPAAEKRKKFVKLKFNPIPKLVQGLKLVVVDDSIVRATTTPRVIQFLTMAGVKAIDLRICSPPIRFPCHLGIDTPTYEELVRTEYKNDKEVVEFLKKETGFQGELTLGHLSLDSAIKATGLFRGNFCTGCFTGHYPINKD